jgi:hypothetical protein
LKAKNNVVVAEVGKASSAPAEMKKALQMGNMEGSISHVISTLPLLPLLASMIAYSLLRPDDVIIMFFQAWLQMTPMNQGHL